MPSVLRNKPDNSKRSKSGKSSRLQMNWMKTMSVGASVFVEPTSVDQIQEIVRDVKRFPSPIRAAGRILSPTSIGSNLDGTTISTNKLAVIHGMKQVKIPCTKDSDPILCIDCEPGVTLRELQLFAHKHNVEVPFCAEIGMATVGGTIFAFSKDSCIGEHPVKGMGLGDMASMLWSVQVVEDDGELKEYCLFNQNGQYDEYFQKLLDSYGVTCIAVRMMIVTRPQTSLTTIIDVSRFDWRDSKVCSSRSEEIYKDWLASDSVQGNMMIAISLEKRQMLMERRVLGRCGFSPLSLPLAAYYNWVKKRTIERGADLPPILAILGARCMQGSMFTRFYQKTRTPGNHYRMDVPLEAPKVSFSILAFPIEKFEEVLSNFLRFTSDYEIANNYKPKLFVITFMKPSGKRVAGPLSIKSSDTFVLDPTTNNPNDESYIQYIIECNKLGKSLGGVPALNQTCCLESDPMFGANAISLQPANRFQSKWIEQFCTVGDVTEVHNPAGVDLV
ncbi:hypothetical protein CTEN210_03723 [Chaetoceros tenuissimus]|uniref:FAD-binding PCMH-type domain-containing protein n=1 Tax=Chaetoceros tenuissimus TaxID=426638 RepID=A0AAD3CKH7_9STRA|nr:hypothetical protein CTEN210_03723 [Chaetoceros tenuissimus]